MPIQLCPWHLQESATWDGSLDFGEQLGASYMAASEAVEREPDLLGSGELGGGGGGDAAAALGSRVAGLLGLPAGRRVSLLAGWVPPGIPDAPVPELGSGLQGHAHAHAEQARPNGFTGSCLTLPATFQSIKEIVALPTAGFQRLVCELWQTWRGCPTGTGCPTLRWRRRVTGTSCQPAWLSLPTFVLAVPAGSPGARCLTQAAGLQSAVTCAP